MKSTFFLKLQRTYRYSIHFVALTLFHFFILTSCHGQVDSTKNSRDSLLDSDVSLFNDSINRPKINVKVNKRYDDNGNIIKYDSTYSFVYKSGTNQMPLNNDSLFKQFKTFFNKQSINQLGLRGGDVFFNDSLFQYDFFNDDYFQKRFELNENLFNDLFKQMDSLKENYLEENYSQNFKRKK